jgi:hypothetical protein
MKRLRSLSHITAFWKAIEMHPKENAFTIAHYCIVYKDLNMLLDLDGMILELLM